MIKTIDLRPNQPLVKVAREHPLKHMLNCKSKLKSGNNSANDMKNVDK